MLSSPADANTPGSLGDHLTQLTSAECAFCLVAARQNVDDGRLTSAFWCPSCAWLSKSLMALSPQPRGKQKNLWTSPCSCSLLSCAYSLILRSRMPAIILEGCLVHVLTPAIHSTFHFVQSVVLHGPRHNRQHAAMQQCDKCTMSIMSLHTRRRSY